MCANQTEVSLCPNSITTHANTQIYRCCAQAQVAVYKAHGGATLQLLVASQVLAVEYTGM